MEGNGFTGIQLKIKTKGLRQSIFRKLQILIRFSTNTVTLFIQAEEITICYWTHATM